MRIKYVLLVLLISILMLPLFVNAKNDESNNITIESIELIDKSENSEEQTEAAINNKNINLDLKLYDPKDYVEYKITIKNQSSEIYSFTENKSTIDKEYITYEIVVDGSKEIAPGETGIVKVKIIYREKVPANTLINDELHVDGSISVSLTKDNKIIINPETGTINPYMYLLLMIISGIGVIVLFKNSIKTKYMLILILITTIIPICVYAEDKFDINIYSNILIDGKEAYFLPGVEFNVKVKKLAGDDTSVDASKTINTSIKKISSSNQKPSNNNMNEQNIVSTNDSPYPIYVWIGDSTLYWWSEDKTPNMNEDSSHMFKSFVELKDIAGLEFFDSSIVNNMFAMFSTSNTEKPMQIESFRYLSNWDVSNVTDMSALFQLNYGIKDFKGLENWDTKKVKTLYLTFGYCNNVESLKELSKWNTSSVENMSGTFVNMPSLKNLDGLEKWDTSNVTTMRLLFSIAPNRIPTGTISKLEDISALTDWNTSNVVDMLGLFQHAKSLKNLNGLKKWDISKISDLRNLCKNCESLTDASGIYELDTSNITTFSNMLSDTINLTEFDLSNYDFTKVNTSSDAKIFNNMPSLQRIKTPKIYPTNSSVKINLPATFCDADNNHYTKLDNTSPTQTWLEKCE